MEQEAKCPVCHIKVRPTDYFCFNCGNNLKPKPLPTSLPQQIIIYLKSIFLTPYGLIIGLRYLREKQSKSKVVGIIAIVLTTISFVIIAKIIFDLVNNINDQVNAQMQQFGYF